MKIFTETPDMFEEFIEAAEKFIDKQKAIQLGELPKDITISKTYE